MKTKNKLGLIAMMSVLGSQSSVVNNISRDINLRKGYPKPSDNDRMKMRGLKEFTYQGVSIWAINQKNADKKAIKQGLLTNKN